jgi:2-C-methyl-D-erythritol 4-phosphate cytidylyltransferase
LQWSLDALAAVAGIEQIVVALPAGTRPPANVTAVVGGEVRSDSVKRALAACAGGDPVLVHDAARPLVTAELAASVLGALARDQTAEAAVAATPVSDTVKRVQAGSDVVSATLERRGLWAVQTPQVFRRRALERALDVPSEVLAQATDDAWLIERAGGKVIVVPASEENIKVTTPLDLQLAELLLARRRAEGR